jgi:hypothetical protein
MSNDKNVKIVFTPEQKTQLEKSTGKSFEAIELTVEELEQRIAPKTWAPPV